MKKQSVNGYQLRVASVSRARDARSTSAIESISMLSSIDSGNNLA